MGGTPIQQWQAKVNQQRVITKTSGGPTIYLDWKFVCVLARVRLLSRSFSYYGKM